VVANEFDDIAGVLLILADIANFMAMANMLAVAAKTLARAID